MAGATWGVTTGNLDGDGDVDLAAACTGSDELCTLLGDGAGGFAGSQTFAGEEYPLAIVAVDLDEDGFDDLVVANKKSESVTFFINQP